MPQRPEFSLGAVILAAGASSRMGRPKLLLPWGPTTVLGHLIALWSDLRADQIAPVWAVGDTRIDDELDRLGVPAEDRIVNPNPDLGMFGSIQCAARWQGWKSNLNHWAIVLGDQPHLQRATLENLIDSARDHPERIVQPGRRGRPRHPVVLPAAVFWKLREAEEETLKQFLQSTSADVELVDSDDPGLDLDIDGVADYEKARRLFE